MRLFSVVLFILFNIYLIECKSNNRTESGAEKLIRFRSDKNKNVVEEKVEDNKSDEVIYEEYEYSDDGTLDNDVLGKGNRIENNGTESFSEVKGESFPNEVFLSLRNITADAATAFRSFTNKNADLLASASDNLNVTYNDTFDGSESGGINRALRDAGLPSDIINSADISPTYQPYTHKKIDTADLSDCALQGEWKPMGVTYGQLHQQITVESDGGSQHGQADVLQSVGSYAVPNKVIPYWQNNFGSGHGGVQLAQNHKPFGGQGSSNNYGSGYGYGAFDAGSSSAGFSHLNHGNSFSSAGQFQKIKSSSMLSPPPYPPIIIGKKPGFYKSQKSKHKFYNYKRPRPSGYAIGSNGYSSYGSNYGGDVKAGSFGGHLNLNNGAGSAGDLSLTSENFKHSGGGFSGNLYGNRPLSSSYGLYQYGNGGSIGNSAIHLSLSNGAKTVGQEGGEGGGSLSIFAHNNNIGSTYSAVKDLLHYGNGGTVGGTISGTVGGTVGGNGGGLGTKGAQVLLHQGSINGGGIGTGINLVETSHVDLLHPGNQGLGVPGIINEENSNKGLGNLDDVNHSSSSGILHHGNSGASSALTQEISASSINTGHAATIVQSANEGGSLLNVQQNSFGNVGHSGSLDLLHPNEIALVTGLPQNSALQSGELTSETTISSNGNYGGVSSNNKDFGTGLSSGFNQGIATGNLITATTSSINSGSHVDAGIGHLLLRPSGIGQSGNPGSSYLSNVGQFSHSVNVGEKLIPDPAFLKSYYGQSTRGGNSLSDSSFLSSQISQNFHFQGQDPSTFTCGKNHDHNTNYHTATFQVADHDHPSSVDVLQYQGDAAVLIKAESVPFQNVVSPERKNYNSLEAEPSSEIISQTAPLPTSEEQETGQSENEPTKVEDDEESERKSYYHEITKVTKVPATSVGNIQYTYNEYETKPQTFTQNTEISSDEQETERPQIIKELEQLTNKFQLDPDNPQKLFEDPPRQEVNYPFEKDEHHHEEAEKYHYTSQDYSVKNQAHNFVTEFPSQFTSSPPVQLVYKKPYVKYVSRPGNNLLFQKPKAAYFPSKVPVNLLRKQKPVQFNKNQNYNVQELGGERHRPIGEIFPTQKSPKQFYNIKPNFAVEVPKGGWPKSSKPRYQVNFTNGKVIKKITTQNRQKISGPILIQKHGKLSPQVIRVVKVSV